MANLIKRYVLGLLPKMSLSAEKRDEVAEALTQYIEAQVASELDQVRERELSNEAREHGYRKSSSRTNSSSSVNQTEKPPETMIGTKNTP